MICIECGAQNTEHYYYKAYNGERKPFSKCVKCHNLHNKPNYVKKGTGWAKVPEDQKLRIKELLKDRRNKIKTIAEEEGIKYANLVRWIHKGHITLD